MRSTELEQRRAAAIAGLHTRMQELADRLGIAMPPDRGRIPGVEPYEDDDMLAWLEAVIAALPPALTREE